jgi:hypothetical protein
LYAWQVDPRTKARDDVRDIFARAPQGPPVRTCPSCGAEHATLSPFCPSCDKRYDRRFARVSDRQRWVLGGLALVVVIAAAALILPGVFEAKRATDARVAREQAARVAAERKRLIREQRPKRARPAALRAPRAGASPAEQLAARRRLVTALEGAIFTDARARVASGELDGPIKRVTCGPLIHIPGNRGEEEDLSKTQGRYDCVAVKREVVKGGKVVGLFGHPFVGTADFKRFAYVWCKDNKVPGESGKALVKVPIPAVCIGAEGRPRVGDGYLSASP